MTPSESKKGIIILDIDGTIVDEALTHEPSEKIITAVAKLQGYYHVTFATGRPWRLTEEIAGKLGITEPIIVLGGTEIRNPDGSILWEVDIESQQVEQIMLALSDYSDYPLLVNDYSLAEYNRGGDYKFVDIASLERVRLLELAFLKEEDFRIIESRLSTIDGVHPVRANSLREGLIDLHVMSSFATKEHAITELLKLTQVDVDKTIGVGDGHNDLHLFNSVKTKIAMGNAVPELKAAADRVIGTVGEDGLADFLMELVDEASN